MVDSTTTHEGTIAQAVATAGAVASSLTPPFLGLLCINVVFIGMIFLLLDRAAEHRSDLINHVLAACTAQLEKK